MRLGLAVVIVALVASFAATLGRAEEPAIEAARQTLGEAYRDPSAIERARDALQDAIRGSGAERAEPAILIEASRVWYLYGEIRTAGEEQIAAFDRGRTIGEIAVRRVPEKADAHLWYAINLARWAEERGIFRSIVELSTVKREVAETLRLAPDLPDAHAFAGGLAAHLPGLLGGDMKRAEERFRRAVALDPHRTRFHLELALVLIETGRPDEARVELRRVLDEVSPSDRLFTTLYDRPRAQKKLAELGAAAR